jgi:hypothetical protein
MLMICAFGFIVPAVFSLGTPDGTRDLSLEMSFVLVALYGINVAVTLFSSGGGTGLTVDEAFADEHPDSPLLGEPRDARRGRGFFGPRERTALDGPRAHGPAVGALQHLQRPRAARRHQ